MPALIRELAVAGSRKSDGSANASGKVFLYEPGTTTLVPGYTDDTLSEAWTTDGGGIPLDAGGRVAIWINDMIDIVVSDADGATVNTFIGYNKTRAEQVEVENDYFTGTLDDGSQGAGGKTDLDTILTSLGSSAGGTDGKYLESPGGAERTIHDKLSEIWISVKDFGAIGNGVADDGTAIQEALNRAKALGGAVVYFPPGTYRVSTALALASATGVSLRGAGLNATTITTASTTSNVFELTTCTGFSIEDIRISAAATNVASAIVLTSCSSVTLTNVLVNAASGGTFLIPLIALTTSTVTLNNVSLTANAADANARAIRITGGSGVVFVGGNYNGLAGAAMEFAGTTSFVRVFGAAFGNVSANIGILWTAAMTGTDFTVVGCPTLRSGLGTITTPFDLSALSTDPRFRQWGNEVDGTIATQASGGGGGSNYTPNRALGSEIHLSLTSGGAAVCTLNAPTPAPSTAMRGVRLTLRLTAAAGGAITWTFNAVYVLVGGGTTIAGADGTTTTIEFNWDVNTSEWRECFRSATAT